MPSISIIGNLHGEQIARSSRDEFLGLDYKNGVVDGEFEHRKGKDKVAVQYKQNKLQKNNQEKKGRRVIARSEDDVYWSEIISACAKMCKKEFNGRLCGDGATAPWDIERIALTFEMSRKVTLQEARNLATTLKRNVSDIVNAHEKIRPYLREYPFSPQRTDIDIEFTKTGGEVDRVSHCSWYDEIRYWKGENCICAETYEEAVRALR